MLGKRPSTHSKRPRHGGSSFPAWFIFLIGMALAFGAYYLWVGVNNFVASGGLGVAEATQRIVALVTATAEQVQTREASLTPRATETPLPVCLDFVVIVPSAIVRAAPNTAAPILDALPEGTTVCVIETTAEDADWYLIDTNPRSRHRIEAGYMYYNIIEAVNPTPTPSDTFTPAPSVTPLPTITPSVTPTITPTDTPNPNVTPTLPGVPTAPVEGA